MDQRLTSIGGRAAALRYRRPVAALVAVLGLAACAPAVDDPPAPAPAPVPVLVPGEPAFALDAYVYTSDEERTVLRAKELLIAACLGGREVRVLPAMDVLRQRQIRTFTEEYASAHGLRPPEPEPMGAAAQQSTVDGHCAAEAERRLNDGYDGPHAKTTTDILISEYVSGLRGQAIEATAADRGYATLLRRWSACIRAAGYPYATPGAMRKDPQWNTPRPGATELATARADARCRAEVDYAETYIRLRTGYEERVATAHRQELGETAKLLRCRLRNATDVVSAVDVQPGAARRAVHALVRLPLTRVHARLTVDLAAALRIPRVGADELVVRRVRRHRRGGGSQERADG